MSARRRHKHHEEEHENHERWLVSGYDMMTLLFAVFVVLFAISSTNVSKVKLLQQSLQEAFSGPVFDGGRAMMNKGGTSQAENQSPTPPLPPLTPAEALDRAMRGEEAEGTSELAQKAADEEQDFQELKRRIDALAEEAGIADKVQTTVSLRGLRIKLLTDNLFFDSGSAVVNPAALPTLASIGGVVAREGTHPVQVEGHTDNRPITTAQYPSNWQLSGARAAAVVQRLAAAGVAGKRMSLGGYAAKQPVARNSTAAGRAQNRRVEVVLARLHGANPSHGGDTS